MALEVVDPPGCPDPTGKYALLQIIISIVSTIMIFIIALYVTIQSITELSLLNKNNQKVYSFFNRTFYGNISLFWLSFIGYSVRIGICILNYFADNISVHEAWITLFGLLGTTIWIFQLFTVEINSVGRLYYTFDNTIYQVSICYIVLAFIFFIIALGCAIGGVLVYFLSHIVGYEQYRHYVKFLILIGGVIIMSAHYLTIGIFAQKLLALLKSAAYKQPNAVHMSNDMSKDKRSSLLNNECSLTKELSVSVNGLNASAVTPHNNSLLNRKDRTLFSDKEKELIQMTSKLLTLSFVGYMFLLIPITLGVILGLSWSNNIDLFLSWIASMVFISYGVFIKVFMYMHFPFGNKLYYHYCRCFKCCDFCIRRRLVKRVYQDISRNKLDLSYESTVNDVLKYEPSHSQPNKLSTDTNHTNQATLSQTRSTVQGLPFINKSFSKSGTDIITKL